MINQKETTLLFVYGCMKDNPVVSVKNTGQYLKQVLDKLYIFDDKGVIIDFYLTLQLSDKIIDKNNTLTHSLQSHNFEIKLNDIIDLKSKRTLDFTKKIKEKVFGYYDKTSELYGLYIHKDLIKFNFKKSECSIIDYDSSLYTQTYYCINDNISIIKHKCFDKFDDVYPTVRDTFYESIDKIKNIFFYDNLDSSHSKLHDEFKKIENMYDTSRISHSNTLQKICQNWNQLESAEDNMKKYLE